MFGKLSHESLVPILAPKLNFISTLDIISLQLIHSVDNSHAFISHPILNSYIPPSSPFQLPQPPTLRQRPSLKPQNAFRLRTHARLPPFHFHPPSHPHSRPPSIPWLRQMDGPRPRHALLQKPRARLPARRLHPAIPCPPHRRPGPPPQNQRHKRHPFPIRHAARLRLQCLCRPRYACFEEDGGDEVVGDLREVLSG